MAKFQYVIGDLFDNIPEILSKEKVIIAHVVNNKKVMGAGFVVPLMKEFPKIKECYIAASDSIPENRRLGAVYFHQDEYRDIIIANMFAQNGVGHNPELLHPLSYDALENCMLRVLKKAKESKSSIIAPKFGSALAGGSWPIIEAMINVFWVDEGIDVTIYSLE
jgi:hypothetical protein